MKTNDRSDPRRIEVVQALLGTCDGTGLTCEVSFKPKENKETVMWSRCTNCPGGIRNRTSDGKYLITKKEAEEFAEIGKIDLPDDASLRKYELITNFCGHCKQKADLKVELVKR